jgi:hypothetical protein
MQHERHMLHHPIQMVVAIWDLEAVLARPRCSWNEDLGDVKLIHNEHISHQHRS